MVSRRLDNEARLAIDDFEEEEGLTGNEEEEEEAALVEVEGKEKGGGVRGD